MLAVVVVATLVGALPMPSAAAASDLPAASGMSAASLPLAVSAPLDDSGFVSLVPSRVLDTRSGVGAPRARLGAASSLDVQVTGVGGVPASGVGAVVVNVTAVDPSHDSYLTVWPSGQPLPDASNLNYRARTTVANSVIAKVGANGRVSLFNYDGAVDVLVDVQGWFPSGSAYVPLVPSRVLDTRSGVGAPRAVGCGEFVGRAGDGCGWSSGVGCRGGGGERDGGGSVA